MRKLTLTSPWDEFDWAKLNQGGKSACVVRYGAFGDLIQASSVFPALKDLGYSVTVNTTERGYQIIRNDPNVDCILEQKTDQVPNDLLGEYWNKISSQFDLFVNLSESVERSLLSIQGDRSWNWHKSFRDLIMNVDYLDAVHAIAGVPNAPKRPKFYPSNRETEKMGAYRRKLGLKNKVILWALSGSSVHKYYPGMDQVIANIMIGHPDTIIVMVGDEACKILEWSWKNEPRVKRKSGRWSIRETLSFIQFCDVIVGTETGVMNAASFEPMKKVLMLSHSSPLNIGGSWLNTDVITPKDCDCYPCHKLHYGWNTCCYDEVSGGALCAAKTDPDSVYRAIAEAL